jgi:anaerobic selenocysteine-containing dehydrogenase
VARDTINAPLRVSALLATRGGDPERGPMVIMATGDARSRLLTDGELAWVYGPKRHELATVRIDPGARDGEVVLRDITGARPSESVKVIKPDLDTRGRRPHVLG